MSFEDIDEDYEKGERKVKAIEKDYKLTNLSEGQVLSLDDLGDPAFKSRKLGQGIAIKSETGKIFAPTGGVLSFLYPTKHALGLSLDNGIELLIHIGINTVELKGKYFTENIKEGMRFEPGDLIMTFDKEQIEAAGYDPTIIVVVTNSNDYREIIEIPQPKASLIDPILEIKK